MQMERLGQENQFPWHIFFIMAAMLEWSWFMYHGVSKLQKIDVFVYNSPPLPSLFSS